MIKFRVNLHSDSRRRLFRAKPIYECTKRFLDFVFALLLLVILFGPMLLIAVAVRVESGSPVLYRQERLGRFGRPFMMIKFRTMVPSAERDGPVWTVKNDPRRTRTGIFLRRFHLDELPQLWNILRGDMSFVGPRPERSFFYEKFRTGIPEFEKRLLVRPGLTGYAQVNGGYELTPENKFDYDMEYIRRRSLLFDAYCVMRTVPTVLFGRGAR